MHEVLAVRQRQVAADRAGGGRPAVGGPVEARTTAIAWSPSSTIATSGPEVMNSRSGG